MFTQFWICFTSSRRLLFLLDINMRHARIKPVCHRTVFSYKSMLFIQQGASERRRLSLCSNLRSRGRLPSVKPPSSYHLYHLTGAVVRVPFPHILRHLCRLLCVAGSVSYGWSQLGANSNPLPWHGDEPRKNWTLLGWHEAVIRRAHDWWNWRDIVRVLCAKRGHEEDK